MEDSAKLFYTLLYEEIDTETFNRMYTNPILEYEKELIEGPIIDIGCGQSNILMNFANSNKKLIAVDKEEVQLSLLKKRVEELSNPNLDNWSFVNLNFPEKELPKANYSLVILSFFLHFFELEDCKKIINKIEDLIVTNSLIYVKVHSSKHHYSKLDDSDYFKHFFNEEDLDILFPPDLFEKLYYADVEKITPKIEMDLSMKHTEELFKMAGITDRNQIDKQLKQDKEDNKQFYLELIVRKK